MVPAFFNRHRRTTWGATSIKLRRLAAKGKASYANNRDIPRGGFRSARADGRKTGNNPDTTFTYPCRRHASELLPNPRRVSLKFHKDIEAPSNRVGPIF